MPVSRWLKIRVFISLLAIFSTVGLAMAEDVQSHNQEAHEFVLLGSIIGLEILME